VRIKACIARYGWLAAIAFVYLYVVPYFPRIHSANELPRVYLVKAIVEDHTFAIDRSVARWGATADVSPSGGHQYSNKAPGSSLLAVPAYAAVRAVLGEPSLGTSLWLCRVFAGILPMLGFLWFVWGFLARFAPDPGVRRLVVLAYALGSLAMTYSILFFSHQLGAICIASAWILALDVAEGRRGLAAMAVAGLLAGAAPLADYQAVFAALPVAVQVIARLRRGPGEPRIGGLVGAAPVIARPAARVGLVAAVAVAAVAAALPIAGLLGYHAICFGSPWRTGYDASTTFAVYHQQGFLGMTEPRWVALWGSLLRPDNGLITLSPWWLLAVPGCVALWRTHERATAGVALAAVIIYVSFLSSLTFWRAGWEVGPRYIAAMLPFLLPPIAAQLQRWANRPVRFGIAAGLIGAGVTVYVLSSATFPYWPDSVAHPLYDVTLRLLRDDLVAPNLGSALGVPGIAGIVPYLAVAFGALGVAVWRVGGTRSLAIAAALAAAILVAYGALPRGEPRADTVYRSVRAAVLDL